MSKASEVIEKLQELMEKHGDLEVYKYSSFAIGGQTKLFAEGIHYHNEMTAKRDDNTVQFPKCFLIM